MITDQLISGAWVEGSGTELTSTDPSTGEVFWSAKSSSESDVAAAVQAARAAFPAWRSAPVEARQAILDRFAELVEERAETLALEIARDNGKPLWEARTEVGSLKTKVAATLAAFEERASEKSQDVKGRRSVTRFRPHGVMAVLGPFNFPMSMPNSHVMPALYAGNTVVFKPSDKTPAAGLAYAKLWSDAGLPDGVLNLVQGDGSVGESLVGSADIDGVLFIGSYDVGMAISRRLAGHPEKQLTLEMGGNAPLVVWDFDDVRLAVHVAIQSAYISAGQRCTAARRLIVNRAVATEFVGALSAALARIEVGPARQTDPEPFMGPMISASAAAHYQEQLANLVDLGANVLVASDPLPSLGEAFVRPGLIDVTGIEVPDQELFGPMLQLSVVDSLDSAVATANATKFGLAAGIVAKDRSTYEQFFDNTKAGIVNWNQPLTGATTVAPFGGVKASGNFRPGGFLSVDYCSYAIASIEDDHPSTPEKLSPGLDY